jgi:hypothetical protein
MAWHGLFPTLTIALAKISIQNLTDKKRKIVIVTNFVTL